ncbi:hypothetical protein NOCARDAX2BIS_380089 [Nocardioides sp. AX2bis]|nr:hypothetical protein NOCARDAX2BIS_380089 [Nocardioides sp. AX2bis]
MRRPRDRGARRRRVLRRRAGRLQRHRVRLLLVLPGGEPDGARARLRGLGRDVQRVFAVRDRPARRAAHHGRQHREVIDDQGRVRRHQPRHLILTSPHRQRTDP